MKRKQTRRKIDPNKVYAFIGRIVVYGAFYVGEILLGYWGFLQATVYR